jgi:hypothetical protein
MLFSEILDLRIVELKKVKYITHCFYIDNDTYVCKMRYETF